MRGNTGIVLKATREVFVGQKTVKEVGLGIQACTRIVAIQLLNAQGNACTIIPKVNVFLLQNKHATYNARQRCRFIFIFLIYGKQTFKQVNKQNPKTNLTKEK